MEGERSKPNKDIADLRRKMAELKNHTTSTAAEARAARGDTSIRPDPRAVYVSGRRIWKFTDGTGYSFFTDEEATPAPDPALTRPHQLTDVRRRTDFRDRIKQQEQLFTALNPAQQSEIRASGGGQFRDFLTSHKLGQAYAQALVQRPR